MLKRNLRLTFALVLPAVLFAATGAAPAAQVDTLVQEKEVVRTPDTTARRNLGRLSIVSTPTLAEVSVDSLSKGETPVVVDSLTPGPHVIIVKAMGYFGKKVIIDAVADSTVKVAVTLVAPARLILISDPAGATALMDDKEMGVTPLDDAKLKPGDHTVRLDKAGFISFEKQVVFTEGKTDTMSIILQPVLKINPPPKQSAAPPKKRGFDRMVGFVALGAFVLFGVVLLGVEMHEAAK